MPSTSRADGEEVPEEGELRVSTLELFFDLVFVFTLTQLTSLLAHDLSGESVARVVLVFIVFERGPRAEACRPGSGLSPFPCRTSRARLRGRLPPPGS